MYSNACLYTRPTAKNTIDGVERKLLYKPHDDNDDDGITLAMRHRPT